MGRALAWLAAAVLLAAVAQAQTPTPVCVAYSNMANGGSNAYVIGRGVSDQTDCLNFHPDPPGFVLGAFNGLSHAPWVIKVGAAYFMYFGNQNQIYVTTSSDGVHWGTPTTAIAGPSALFASVIYDPTDGNSTHRYKMMYSQLDGGAGSHPYAFFVAYSSNGLTWTPRVGAVMTNSVAGWDNGGVLSGTLHYNQDPAHPKWWLEYLGCDTRSPVAHCLPGLATAPSIEGPWTKSPSNPLVQTRPNARATTTTAWLAGTQTVQIGVDPSTVFMPFETVEVNGTNPNGGQIVQIVAMSWNPAAQTGVLTFDQVPENGVTQPAGSSLVSLYSGNFDPGQIYRDPATGTVRMLCQGSWYTFPGLIREYGMYMIANTPTPGPTPTGTPPDIWDTTSWSFDYQAGAYMHPRNIQPYGLTSNENPQFLLDFSASPTPTPTPLMTTTPTPTPTATFHSTRTPFSCPGGPG